MTEPKDRNTVVLACGTCHRPIGETTGGALTVWVDGHRLTFETFDAPDLRVWCKGCRRHGVIDVQEVLAAAERRPARLRSRGMPVDVRWIYAD